MKLEKLIKVLEIIGAIITSVITIMEATNSIKANLDGLKLLSAEEEPDT